MHSKLRLFELKIPILRQKTSFSSKNQTKVLEVANFRFLVNFRSLTLLYSMNTSVLNHTDKCMSCVQIYKTSGFFLHCTVNMCEFAVSIEERINYDPMF